jgi:hypothetical protein
MVLSFREESLAVVGEEGQGVVGVVLQGVRIMGSHQGDIQSWIQ